MRSFSKRLLVALNLPPLSCHGCQEGHNRLLCAYRSKGNWVLFVCPHYPGLASHSRESFTDNSYPDSRKLLPLRRTKRCEGNSAIIPSMSQLHIDTVSISRLKVLKPSARVFLGHCRSLLYQKAGNNVIPVTLCPMGNKQNNQSLQNQALFFHTFGVTI